MRGRFRHSEGEGCVSPPVPQRRHCALYGAMLTSSSKTGANLTAYPPHFSGVVCIVWCASGQHGRWAPGIIVVDPPGQTGTHLRDACRRSQGVPPRSPTFPNRALSRRRPCASHACAVACHSTPRIASATGSAIRASVARVKIRSPKPVRKGKQRDAYGVARTSRCPNRTFTRSSN